MTKAELKKMAQKALRNEYGFAPSVNSIVLLETDNVSYVLVEINGKEYRVNNGTVERVEF